MFLRARRIWKEEGNKSALSDSRHLLRDHQTSTASPTPDSQALLTASTLSAALMLAHNPRLLAQELSTAISILDCSPRVQLLESSVAAETTESGRHCVVRVGVQKGTSWTLVCEIPDDPLKALALGDVARIGASAIALQERLEEAKNKAALWPASPVEEEAGALFTGEEMQRLLATARRVAATNVSVLLTGETGTGKEVLARTIHGYSTRAKATFLPFNCTSTPKDMLDSQLFGHRRGSFTGATENFQGIIRAATGGTLFLDEIGDMPLDVQPKLLRFLESGEVHPVGETQPVRVDVRVIAATNANLDALVTDGRFREDLFYRLNIVRLHLPPLRERRMEIPALAQHYLQRYAQEYGKGDLRLSEETMEYLLLYRWPGNIRQLANEMRRMAALCEAGAVLMPEHLSPDIAASRRTIPASERVLDLNEVVVRLDQPLAAATEHLERALVLYGLKQCGGRMEETATLLGISRKGLYLKRQRFGIETPETPTPVGVLEPTAG
jgi:DNA-binding NtrC family response regulator